MPESLELSREELVALLAARDARIDALLVQVGELTGQVQTLVLRLGKDSGTSSKPPNSDGPGRRPRGGSSRGRSGRKPGKQPGAALRLVDDPQERIEIPAPVVCGCAATAVGEFPAGVSAPARYGPEVTAKAADVVLGHHVPVHRLDPTQV